MDLRTFESFCREMRKIAEEISFKPSQYRRLFGPKVLRRDKRFTSQKDDPFVRDSSTLTNKDETYHPLSSQARVLENRETPGGPI
ncbi:MAG: hypothetical protein E6R04_09260 [Spirochaetes bacterium]|nr:MAG: hypothetical protein E6R04_09260 [Spirochaetota bacterium]